MPSIGPVLVFTILAEAVNLCHFKHHRQFLNFATPIYRPSSRADSRSHLAVEVWERTPSLCLLDGGRAIPASGTRRDPASAERKHMTYVAVVAKMARMAHGIIKAGYRFPLLLRGRGTKWKRRFTWGVEAVMTL
jgi:hypothetical protein